MNITPRVLININLTLRLQAAYLYSLHLEMAARTPGCGHDTRKCITPIPFTISGCKSQTNALGDINVSRLSVARSFMISMISLHIFVQMVSGASVASVAHTLPLRLPNKRVRWNFVGRAVLRKAVCGPRKVRAIRHLAN